MGVGPILYQVSVFGAAFVLLRVIVIGFLWIYIVAAVLLSTPIKNLYQNIRYKQLIKKTIR